MYIPSHKFLPVYLPPPFIDLVDGGWLLFHIRVLTFWVLVFIVFIFLFHKFLAGVERNPYRKRV